MSKTDMSLHPIRTDADYRAALLRAEAIFDAAEEPDPQSEVGAFFEALLTRIEAYERKHCSVLLPDPLKVIRFRMEQAGLTVKDLEPLRGRSNQGTRSLLTSGL